VSHSRLVALVESEALLCPSCTRREIDTPSGLCARCVVERVRENYVERDHAAVSFRFVAWSERTTRADAEAVKLRQQRSRIRAAVRPREPAPVGTDPWALGAEAVQLLGRVRSAIPRTSTRAGDLERAVELVRQLAWGPQG
jgi:hypothetical protein